MERSAAPRRLAALAVLGAALCATAGCGTSVCRDAWLGPTKLSHFAAGFAVGAATSTLGGHAELSASGSAVLGFGSAAAVAAGKETADLKVSEGCWSWKDFTWMLLGGAVGSTVGTAVSH